MKLDIRDNIKEVTKGLSRTQRKQIPFAASRAINDLLFPLAKKELPREMDDTFKGGATGFTKRAFRYAKSNKKNLSAIVFAGPKQDEYLKFMVDGGTRFPGKGSLFKRGSRALVVSTKNSKLNKYGNIPKATRDKIFDDDKKFFKGIPKGAKFQSEGIWERYGRQRWSKKEKKKIGGRIRMVAAYKQRAQYQPLFPFAEVAGNVVFSRDDGFARKFRRRLEQALATAR